jgi:hypothetical protein
MLHYTKDLTEIVTENPSLSALNAPYLFFFSLPQPSCPFPLNLVPSHPSPSRPWHVLRLFPLSSRASVSVTSHRHSIRIPPFPLAIFFTDPLYPFHFTQSPPLSSSAPSLSPWLPSHLTSPHLAPDPVTYLPVASLYNPVHASFSLSHFFGPSCVEIRQKKKIRKSWEKRWWPRIVEE